MLHKAFALAGDLLELIPEPIEMKDPEGDGSALHTVLVLCCARAMLRYAVLCCAELC